MAGRPTTWMPLYVADYLADTAHLTAAQSGAYLHLIMAYWRAGGPLRLDDGALARTARMTPTEWSEAAGVVLAFFRQEDGALHHGRIEHELAEAAAMYEARRKRTEAATAARAARNVTNNVTSDVTNNVTLTQPQRQPQPPFPMERDTVEVPLSSGGSGGTRAARADRGTRLPADWAPTEDDRGFAASLGVAVEREAASFRDYWTSKPGADGRKTNWSATWRNWVRRTSERKQGNGTGSRSESRNGFIVLAERLAREDADRAAGRPAGDFFDPEGRG